MYSNSCCSYSFKPEILISQSSHKMYSNNILNFQESTTMLNACSKKARNLMKDPHMTARNLRWFDGLFVKWHINLWMLFNAKAIHLEEQQ